MVRKDGESLQELAQEVRHAVKWAYPYAWTRTHDDLAKDTFIQALGDSGMRWKVFLTRPKQLSEALKVALELEAFEIAEQNRLVESVQVASLEASTKNMHVVDSKCVISPVEREKLTQMLAQILTLSCTHTDPELGHAGNDLRTSGPMYKTVTDPLMSKKGVFTVDVRGAGVPSLQAKQ